MNDIESVSRRLAGMWYLVFGTIVAIVSILFFLNAYGIYSGPGLPDVISNNLHLILAFATLMATIGVVTIKKFATRKTLVERLATTDDTAEARVRAAMFKVLAVADTPSMIGLGLYLASPQDWLAVATITYAVVASAVFKPNLKDWLLKAERNL